MSGGLSFHIGTSTGSTVAIAMASKASKKVATPTMIRVFMCHHAVGSRSILAAISPIEPAVVVGTAIMVPPTTMQCSRMGPKRKSVADAHADANDPTRTSWRQVGKAKSRAICSDSYLSSGYG